MDLNLSFTKNPQNNDILVLNLEQSIRASIKNLIFTTKGERIFQPFLGTSLHTLLFEIADTNLANSLIEQIKTVLTIYEPRISINTIDVYLQDDEITLSVTIDYTILSMNLTDSITSLIVKNR